MTTQPTGTQTEPAPKGPSKLLISTDFLLEGESVALRLGRPTDWQAWRDLRSQSRDFLTPWEPTWPAGSLTYGTFTQNLETQWREWKEDRGYTFLAFLKEGAKSEPAAPQTEAPETSNKRAFFSHFGRRPSPHLMMRELSELRPSSSQQPQPQPHFQDKPPEKKQQGPLIGSIALTALTRGAAQKATLGYWIGAPYARQGLMSEAASLVRDFAFGVLRLHRIEASCMPANEASLKLLGNLGFEKEGLAKAALRINGRWEDHELMALLED